GYLDRLEIASVADEVRGRPARILEVGVGSGANLPLLEERLGRAGAAGHWGPRYSAGMPAQSPRPGRAGAPPPGPLLLRAAHALPSPDHAFDRVLHVGGIATFRDPAFALAEMARVARPGTPIVVVDEQLDPDAAHCAWYRWTFRAITFYDAAPVAPRDRLPAD